MEHVMGKQQAFKTLHHPESTVKIVVNNGTYNLTGLKVPNTTRECHTCQERQPAALRKQLNGWSFHPGNHQNFPKRKWAHARPDTAHPHNKQKTGWGNAPHPNIQTNIPNEQPTLSTRSKKTIDADTHPLCDPWRLKDEQTFTKQQNKTTDNWQGQDKQGGP